jgi:hypothetical protein
MKSKNDVSGWLMDASALRFDVNAPLSGPERWLMTLAAPVSVLHGDVIDSIPTGRSAEAMRRRLAQTSGIQDRAGFERAARWFAEGGDRRRYRVLWRLMLRMYETNARLPVAVRALLGPAAPALAQARLYRRSDYQLVAERLKMRADVVRRKLVASRSWVPQLEHALAIAPDDVQNLIAWGGARLVALSRWAVGAGYIDRSEFSKYAGGLGHQIRGAYRDWHEFSAAYVIGGLIWNDAMSRRVQLLGGVRLLNTHQRSPFRQVAYR